MVVVTSLNVTPDTFKSATIIRKDGKNNSAVNQCSIAMVFKLYIPAVK